MNHTTQELYERTASVGERYPNQNSVTLDLVLNLLGFRWFYSLFLFSKTLHLHMSTWPWRLKLDPNTDSSSYWSNEASSVFLWKGEKGNTSFVFLGVTLISSLLARSWKNYLKSTVVFYFILVLDLFPIWFSPITYFHTCINFTVFPTS